MLQNRSIEYVPTPDPHRARDVQNLELAEYRARAPHAQARTRIGNTEARRRNMHACAARAGPHTRRSLQVPVVRARGGLDHGRRASVARNSSDVHGRWWRSCPYGGGATAL